MPSLIDCQLLSQLLTADGPVAFDRLRTQHGHSSPAQINAELQRLREVGCRLHVHPHHGVQLLETDLGAWSDLLAQRYPQQIIEVYRRTGSTQDAARRMVASHGPMAHRAIAVADQQTAGRGRLGRSWVTPPAGAVLFSRVAIDAPQAASSDTDHLTLIAAVGVARGIEQACRHRLRVQIKWPNDLLIDRRKVAGILVETQTSQRIDAGPVHAAILGVGINVTQIPIELAERRESITSLAAAGCAVDRLRVLVEVLAALDSAAAQGDHALLAEWRNRCVTLSQTVHLHNNGRRYRGQVMDLDPHDGLIVRTDAGAIVHLPAATTSTADEMDSKGS